MAYLTNSSKLNMINTIVNKNINFRYVYNLSLDISVLFFKEEKIMLTSSTTNAEWLMISQSMSDIDLEDILKLKNLIGEKDISINEFKSDITIEYDPEKGWNF